MANHPVFMLQFVVLWLCTTRKNKVYHFPIYRTPPFQFHPQPQFQFMKICVSQFICVCVCVFFSFPSGQSVRAGCTRMRVSDGACMCVCVKESIIQLLPYCTCFDLFGIITDAYWTYYYYSLLLKIINGWQ